MALTGFGRFSEPALLVLISLLDGPKHGYAISQDLAGLTGRRPGPGTLYGAISRLEERGLIAAEPRMGAGRRRPYRLTGAGLEEARRELAAMSALMDTARRRLRAATA
jgi:DNA-binding PadR family transcriptional regulator